MNFKCHDYFMVRVPSLPISYLKEYENQEKDIYEFIRSNKDLDDFFKRALIVSSKSLYLSYINKPMDPKKYNNLKESLLKYFIRSIVRTTPYGYFSSVSIGKFSDKTQLIKGKNLIDLKVDNEWINYIVANLEKDNDIFINLKFRFNNMCYKSGDRFKNPYFTNWTDLKDKESITVENSIKYSNLIELVKEKAQRFISYKELSYEIEGEYENVPKSLIKNTLISLMENEYIFSNLRIPSYCEDSLGHIIKVLFSIGYEGEKLQKLLSVQNLIVQFNETQEIRILEDIYKSMGEIKKNKNYLILNQGIELLENKIDISIKSKIEKMVSLLYQISTKINLISEFETKFIERYGMNIEVPLCKIIDKNDFNGLEYVQEQNNSDSYENKINDILNNKIFKTIMTKSDEVQFTEHDFIDIKKDIEKCPKSFDISILITKLNDKYNLCLGPVVASNKAGAMFQRFSRCFNKDDLERYNQIYKIEEKAYKGEYLLVESREQSINGKNNNVINNNKNYEKFIPFGNCYREYDNEICLDDIYIGVSSAGKVYIKSKKYNKKIKIVTDNMLNTSLNNKILKLLKYISETYEESAENRLISIINNKSYNYMPRIKLEDIIISHKRWLLDESCLQSKDFQQFKEKLYICREIYNMDSKLYQTVYDNRIIIDLDKDEYLKILYNEYKRLKKLEFTEIENNLFKGSIIKDTDNNSYVNECVFSIVPCIENKNDEKSNINQNRILSNENGKILLCEQGWIYFKLYGVGDRSNEIITEYLPKLLKSLKEGEHFFIRYKDNDGYHLRIRIKFDNENIAILKLRIINQWAKGLVNKKLINNIVFDSYEKEINRYGGKEIISYCENVFFKNSIVVENLLSKYDLELNNNLEKLYILGIVSILKHLSNDLEEMFFIIDSKSFNDKYRKEYRKNKKIHMKFIEEILEEDIKEFHDAFIEFNKEKEVINDLRIKLNDKEFNKKNTNSKSHIVLSIVHMYCNRLNGNLNYEEKYLEIVRNSLYHILNTKKNKIKLKVE